MQAFLTPLAFSLLLGLCHGFTVGALAAHIGLPVALLAHWLFSH